jgi:malonyl-CoA/methylmalonyl-CoA synthetase
MDHPESELKYFIQDSKVGILLYSKHHISRKDEILLMNLSTSTGIICVSVDDLHYDSNIAQEKTLDTTISHSDALVIYTSGTTGKPKGVVHSHKNVQSMVESLVACWEYTDSDRILHFLPLHHLHGILNKLLCILYSGGTVQFISSSKASHIWDSLAVEGREILSRQQQINIFNNDIKRNKLTLFMGVPTIYATMIEYAKSKNNNTIFSPSLNVQYDETIKLGLVAMQGMRLMACGSAALPNPILNDWKKLTGHTLLERYGMSELGMALSKKYIKYIPNNQTDITINGTT